ncbi:DUF6415 family natural product biosynthesis protein [Streptomyces sp. B15]|uniref:DUF6415 family natural product biosynthesis protein n=1 Tax=Streptomyces sp. B15 TaxID=1537797 RepID=UPI001B35D96F|nr:DUF6415 family natural product biosynthesis protein [Streptomyces sp. B15]MBQ1121899.1 hypothetical protein [Streptomyces sp. B15]
MTTSRPVLPRRERRKLEVEPAGKVPATKLRACIDVMHDWFIQDEEIDDALDAVMGKESALLRQGELDELLPRMRQHLRQLVHIATTRVSGDGGPELAEVVTRAQQLVSTPIPDDFPDARGYARRLALVVGDVLEILAVEQEAAQAEERWLA